ncbi:hypothetical protein J3459_022554 [Metarhizium acridum]|uniref:uncharacterized protein n=1 Tax=Metarhizium acridum TaxID=92637 RepID=UPI001C6C79E1|nr:hypothetical protein J3459_022554 [Metarhizium acridum]KAG8410774.1 hypothetical protein J3458_022533 [Metarhizium acridum]
MKHELDLRRYDQSANIEAASIQFSVYWQRLALRCNLAIASLDLRQKNNWQLVLTPPSGLPWLWIVVLCHEQPMNDRTKSSGQGKMRFDIYGRTKSEQRRQSTPKPTSRQQADDSCFT